MVLELGPVSEELSFRTHARCPLFIASTCWDDPRLMTAGDCNSLMTEVLGSCLTRPI